MNKNQETRVEFKRQLDQASHVGSQFEFFQDVLNQGPQRSIQVTGSDIYLTMTASGNKYSWKPNDPRTAVTSLVVSGIYEELETSILIQIAQMSSIMIDVGANVGYYAIELGNRMKALSKIVAFEPVSQSFEQLNLNISLNNLESKVKTVQLALSNREEVIDLYIPQVSGSSATSARNLHPQESFRIEEVKTTKLDSFLESNNIEDCDLIKIDVEGAELFVIEGSMATIRKNHPTIFAELLRKWSAEFSYHPNDVIDILASEGYNCFAVSPMLPQISQILESTLETNFLFIHKSRENELFPVIEKIREASK
jgi:FkbM family methyltransferase